MHLYRRATVYYGLMFYYTPPVLMHRPTGKIPT